MNGMILPTHEAQFDWKSSFIADEDGGTGYRKESSSVGRILQKIQDLQRLLGIEPILGALPFIESVTLDHEGNEQTVLQLLVVVEINDLGVGAALGAVEKGRELKAARVLHLAAITPPVIAKLRRFAWRF